MQKLAEINFIILSYILFVAYILIYVCIQQHYLPLIIIFLAHFWIAALFTYIIK